MSDFDDWRDEWQFRGWGIDPNFPTPEDLESLSRQAEKERLEAENFHCACRTGCKTRRCKCFKNGGVCVKTCTCSSCVNPLKMLASFFGKEDVRAGPCFRQWLNAVLPQDRSLSFLSCPIFQEKVRSTLFGVKTGDLSAAPTDEVFVDDFDKDLVQLGKDWTKPGVTDEEREALLRQLFRAAFGIDDMGQIHKKHFFSFCSPFGDMGKWEEADQTHHCEVCGACLDWSVPHCNGR